MVIFGQFFHLFLWFWKPNLHFSADFWLTRAPQLCSQQSSAYAASSSGRVGRRWLESGAHALGSSLLFGAREDHASPFLGRARWQLAIRRRIFVWVVPMMACVLRATVWHLSLLPPLPAACFGIFLPVLSLCSSHVSPVTVCLCFKGIFVG